MCSSVSANSAKMSGDVLGVLTGASLGRGECDCDGGRTSRGVGVGVCCALLACRAFRRYSDLGAMESEAVRVTTGLVWSGVVGEGEGVDDILAMG